jgi:hypothetical protein
MHTKPSIASGIEIKLYLEPAMRIRIRMFLDLLDPDRDPSIIKHK